MSVACCGSSFVTDLRPEKMNGSDKCRESALSPSLNWFQFHHLGRLTVADNDACTLANGVHGDLEREVVGHKNHRLPLLCVGL